MAMLSLRQPPGTSQQEAAAFDEDVSCLTSASASTLKISNVRTQRIGPNSEVGMHPFAAVLVICWILRVKL
jgi:hypothetical protein